MAFASSRGQNPFLSPTICHPHGMKACMTCQRPSSAVGPASRTSHFHRQSSLQDFGTRLLQPSVVRHSRTSAALLSSRYQNQEQYQAAPHRSGASQFREGALSGAGGQRRGRDATESIDWLRAPARATSAQRLTLRNSSLQDVLEETSSSNASKRHSTSDVHLRPQEHAPRSCTACACESCRIGSRNTGNVLRLRTSPSLQHSASLSAGRRSEQTAPEYRPGTSNQQAPSSVESDEVLMEQILQEEAVCVADSHNASTSEQADNPSRSLGTSGAGDLWMLLNQQGHRFVQAFSSPRCDPPPEQSLGVPHEPLSFCPPGSAGARAVSSARDDQHEVPWASSQSGWAGAPPKQPLARDVETAAARDVWQAEPEEAEEGAQPWAGLEAGLRVHALEMVAGEVSKLGVSRVEELGALTEQDVRDARLALNPLQLRRLLTAIGREKAAASRASQEVQAVSRVWAQLCGGAPAGWYAPSFAHEPAGLRITVVEPPDLAGAVFEFAFGQGRHALSPLVAATPSPQRADWSEFCIAVDIGRGDRTLMAHGPRGGGGRLSLAVEGVSREHAVLEVLCGDGVPMEVRLRDLGSTNGTFLLRPPPPSFLPPANSLGGAAGSDAAEGGARAEATPAPLLQLRLPRELWHDLQGIPYVRLGPRLVLGLSVLQGGGAWFGLQEVVHRTEQLLPLGALRQQGWAEARLEDIAQHHPRAPHPPPQPSPQHPHQPPPHAPQHPLPPTPTASAGGPFSAAGPAAAVLAAAHGTGGGMHSGAGGPPPSAGPSYPAHPLARSVAPPQAQPPAPPPPPVPPVPGAGAAPLQAAPPQAPPPRTPAAAAAGGGGGAGAGAGGSPFPAASRSPLPALPAIPRVGSPSLVRPFSAGSHASASSVGDDDCHIFLTYQWDSQKAVKIIAEALKQMGYRVWLDLDKMVGEMNKRMAEAVEGAAAVCPCITRAYKTSANCMKELNYADQRGSYIVPIILDGDCDKAELLSGQVGLITSNLIYVNFGKACKKLEDLPADASPRAASALFESKMKELERALGDRGRATPPAAAQAAASTPAKGWVPSAALGGIHNMFPRQQASV